jgi:hypothetical protein
LRAAGPDWQHGAGPEVIGSGEALLTAMSGRRQVTDEPAGDGAARLIQRLKAGQ